MSPGSSKGCERKKSAHAIHEQLEETDAKLQTYIDTRKQIKCSIQKSFREMERLNAKILMTEERLERLVQEAVEKDVCDAVRHELALIRGKGEKICKGDGSDDE